MTTLEMLRAEIESPPPTYTTYTTFKPPKKPRRYSPAPFAGYGYGKAFRRMK